MPSGPDWNERYAVGDTPWDLAGPAPALVARWRERPFFERGARILVPGAGRGHDALFFAAEGLEVTALDLAELAVRAGREAARTRGLEGRCRFLTGDFFEFAGGPFDGLYEHTCYCAIPPGDRGRYARAAARLLKPGGRLVGLWYPMEAREDGPPYGLDAQEIEARFTSAGFRLVHSEKARGSLPRRAGKEQWLDFVRDETPGDRR